MIWSKDLMDWSKFRNLSPDLSHCHSPFMKKKETKTKIKIKITTMWRNFIMLNFLNFTGEFNT